MQKKRRKRLDIISLMMYNLCGEIMKQITIDYEKLKGAVWGKQPQVAAELGIHPQSLSSKLNKRIRLQLDELNKIAEALGRDTMEFLREMETDGEVA